MFAPPPPLAFQQNDLNERLPSHVNRGSLLKEWPTDCVRVVDVVQHDHVALRVGVQLPEGSGTLLKVQGPPLENVDERQARGGAEAGPAVVHDAVGPHVLRRHLVHTAAGERERTPTLTPLT